MELRSLVHAYETHKVGDHMHVAIQLQSLLVFQVCHGAEKIAKCSQWWCQSLVYMHILAQEATHNPVRRSPDWNSQEDTE